MTASIIVTIATLVVALLVFLGAYFAQRPVRGMTPGPFISISILYAVALCYWMFFTPEFAQDNQWLLLGIPAAVGIVAVAVAVFISRNPLAATGVVAGVSFVSVQVVLFFSLVTAGMQFISVQPYVAALGGAWTTSTAWVVIAGCGLSWWRFWRASKNPDVPKYLSALD